MIKKKAASRTRLHLRSVNTSIAKHDASHMAMTVLAYRRGILSWYDCHISTAKVEGINNKIKVMKRNAYGFRDERYFKLRLYALHDCRITRNVG